MARLNFWPCFSAAKKSLPEIRQGELHTMGVFVQALASRGVATALSGALLSTRPVDQLVVSPQLCGSSLWMIPNPRGSLTYRFFILTILLLRTIVNPKWLFLKISFHSYCGKQRTILLQISSTNCFGVAIFNLACNSHSYPK